MVDKKLQTQEAIVNFLIRTTNQGTALYWAAIEKDRMTHSSLIFQDLTQYLTHVGAEQNVC